MKFKTIVLASIGAALCINCGGKSSQSTGGSISSSKSVLTNFTGYPMDAKNQSVTWFVSNGFIPNTAYATAEQSPFHSYLQEMLGVKINWQFPTTGTDTNQAFNLMMASAKLPDIIYHGVMRDSERYIEEGTIYDLSDHIKEWSPAYYQWLQRDPTYDRSMKTDSGKYYGYGFFREAGGWNDSYLGPVVRKDWLDAQGLPMPETIADWDKTLRVFKEKYGAVLSFAKIRIANDYGTGISGAFGAFAMLDFKLYVDKNNKIQTANIQPEYKNYLAKLNEWWREGLLDQDFLSNDDTMVKTLALNGKIGLSVTSMGQISNWSKEAEAAGNGAQWVGLQYPKGNDGTLSMVPGGYGIGSQASVISTSCPPEKVELAMRILDYAYTEEGNLYWNFGKKGVSWDYDPQGKPAYLPLVTNDPDGLNNAIDKYGGTTWSGSCIQATQLLYLKNAPIAIAANDLWFYPNEDVTASWTIPNGMTLTVDESNRAAELRNSIATYAAEMAAKFITGQASLDTFDAFVAQINSMGLAELVAINQTAYNRYLAR